MCDLLNSILGTIIGGLTLTLILFVLNEIIFPKSNLTGEWVSKITIQETSLDDKYISKTGSWLHLYQFRHILVNLMYSKLVSMHF